jgi:hypothetical protein
MAVVVVMTHLIRGGISNDAEHSNAVRVNRNVQTTVCAPQNFAGDGIA